MIGIYQSLMQQSLRRWVLFLSCFLMFLPPPYNKVVDLDCWKWVLAPAYCWSSVRTSLPFIAEVPNLSNIVSGRKLQFRRWCFSMLSFSLGNCYHIPASGTIERGSNDFIKCWILDQHFLTNIIWSLNFCDWTKSLLFHHSRRETHI